VAAFPHRSGDLESCLASTHDDDRLRFHRIRPPGGSPAPAQAVLFRFRRRMAALFRDVLNEYLSCAVEHRLNVLRATAAMIRRGSPEPT
jgi:hypothetical protein